MPRRSSAENRRFGVEIEFVGIGQSQMLRTLRDAEIPSTSNGSYNRGNWVVKDDGSVHGPRGSGELVSPPLSGVRGLAQVKKVCQTILDAGATANSTCGLHVHVDAAGLTGSQMANVVRLYRDHQSVINQILPTSRHRNRYASPMGTGVNACLTQLDQARGTTGIRSALNYLNRYLAVNLSAFIRHGTIEFRQHNGTTSPSKILSWIKFCLALVEKARSMTSEASLTAPAIPARGRGRPPNYVARRALWEYIGEWMLADDLACSVHIGHSMQTTRRWIRELQTCGAIREVEHISGCYRRMERLSATHRIMLNAWLGRENVAPVHRVTTPIRRRGTHQSLFEGMPPALHRYYTRRAATFGHVWS
jgi:hypothetical protein